MRFRIFPTDNPESNRFDVVDENSNRFISCLSGILTEDDLVKRLIDIYPKCNIRSVTRQQGLQHIDISLLANP